MIIEEDEDADDHDRCNVVLITLTNVDDEYAAAADDEDARDCDS